MRGFAIRFEWGWLLWAIAATALAQSSFALGNTGTSLRIPAAMDTQYGDVVT